MQANDVTLNVFCNVASSASNISSATGQAVLSAIPKFFGDQPCFPRYRLQLAVVGVYCNDCRRAMNVVIAYLYVHAELRLLHDASL